MRVNIKKHLLLLPLLIIITGCSQLNCTRLEDLLGGPTDLVSFSYKIADSLTSRALPPLIPRHPDMPVVVTTFVNNNDLTQTSNFGRLLQEHISSRLVQNGYTVREMKVSNTLSIEPKSGETILSRDLTKLEAGLNSQAILVGTFSHVNRVLYISARLVNPVNNNVIASDDYKLCMDDDILALFGLRISDGGTGSIDEPSQPLLNKIL